MPSLKERRFLMKLDISCIRAILFTVEKYETLYDPVSFDDTKYDYIAIIFPNTILNKSYIMSNTV